MKAPKIKGKYRITVWFDVNARSMRDAEETIDGLLPATRKGLEVTPVETRTLREANV